MSIKYLPEDIAQVEEVVIKIKTASTKNSMKEF
jgi:hypothetical protein